MSGKMKDDGHEPATKGDLRGLATKEEFGTLRGEFGTLRDEFGALRGEFGALRAELREMLRPIMITLANHSAELADIRGYMKDKMVTRDEFHSRMDAFTGRVDDSDYSSAKNRDRLDDHERRISSLEAKRA